MAGRIEDYALIGDCQTAALVCRDGSIDWLCLPRFDSGACFASLLGDDTNGRWQVRPAGEPTRTSRCYRPGTLVLETEIETVTGAVRLIDFMPPMFEGELPQLVRIVQGVRGQVRMRSELIVRFDYGSIVPWVRHHEERDEGGRNVRGIRATAGPDTLYCRSADVDFHGKGFTTLSEFDVSEGRQVAFVLSYRRTHETERIGPMLDVEQALNDTEAWWRRWSDRCTYQGKYREAVVRSLLTLKALTYAPTGGIVAAPTTSLPEHIGGVRNWDYRYCWLRDAAFTLVALHGGGYSEEARAFRLWLIDAVAGNPDATQIMYGLAGERRLPEVELAWLNGYEQSRPVRIGNGAHGQRQLDVYGEVMHTLEQSHLLLGTNGEAWAIARALANFVCETWQEPDQGIWESRGAPRQYTYSKVMAWVAIDRALQFAGHHGQGRDGELERWRAVRQEIHQTVCKRGFKPELNSFVQHFESSDPDASLLMLPLVGFLPAHDPRIRGTVDYICKRLVRDGFVDRYPTDGKEDGLPAGEGSFVICSFWLVSNLILLGRRDEAQAIFERLLDLRNDVGLLAEQYDPVQRRLLGNFPQAFSHIGLVNAAGRLEHGMVIAGERR